MSNTIENSKFIECRGRFFFSTSPRDERRAALRECAAIRAVSLGEDHPLTARTARAAANQQE